MPASLVIVAGQRIVEKDVEDFPSGAFAFVADAAS